MQNNQIKENIEKNKSDIKGILFFLLFLFAAVVYNWDYFFSEETLSQVKVIEPSDAIKGENKGE